MKNNCAIYVIAPHPHYNPDVLPLFESFDTTNSSLLFAGIDLNYKEILSSLGSSYKIKFCFDEKDKEFLPSEFLADSDLFFYDSSSNNIFKILGEKFFSLSRNNLCLISNSIGVTSKDINRAFRLLTLDDDTIVEGKSGNNEVVFLAFNHNNPLLLDELNIAKLNHSEFLLKSCAHKNFIYTVNNFFSILNKEDFKNLYSELSKKESLNYCSQKIHEKFTHLFIEYKEILK